MANLLNQNVFMADGGGGTINQSASSNSDISSLLQSILSQIDDVDAKYSTQFRNPTLDLPESLNLEKLEYSMPDEDELYRLAAESLAAKKLSDVSKAETNLMTGINTIDNQKSKLNIDVEKANKLLDVKATELKNEALSNAIRRGLARSSIKEESINKVETDTNTLKESNISNKQLTIDSLNEQIQRLVTLRDKTLADINSSYNYQTDAKVQSLYSDALKQQDTATKYNNTVDEKEQKYLKSVEEAYLKAANDEWNRIAKIMEMQSKYGTSGMEAQKAEEKYAVIKNFFDGLEPQTALDLFNTSGAFATHLERYYSQMKNYLQKRVSGK